MNDRVNIISSNQEDYAERLQDLIVTRNWTQDMEAGDTGAFAAAQGGCGNCDHGWVDDQLWLEIAV